MTDKTPIGVDFLDSRYGGAFRGRPVLFCGPVKSGKTATAFHFLRRGLRLRERCLMLTARPAADIVVQADAMGLGFSEAVDSGNLILLEYADDVPGRHSESAITLPPDSFMQLAKVVAEQAVARLVLDTCLPWVAVKGENRLEEHVFSFLRSIERMAVTTLLTMPKAASLASARLYKLIEAQVPISVTLDYDDAHESRVMIVNKYLGMDDKVGLEIPFHIQPKCGIAEGAAPKPAPQASVVGHGEQAEQPTAAPAQPSVAVSEPESADKEPQRSPDASDQGLRFSQDAGLHFSKRGENRDKSREPGRVYFSEDVW